MVSRVVVTFGTTSMPGGHSKPMQVFGAVVVLTIPSVVVLVIVEVGGSTSSRAANGGKLGRSNSPLS